MVENRKAYVNTETFYGSWNTLQFVALKCNFSIFINDTKYFICKEERFNHLILKNTFSRIYKHNAIVYKMRTWYQASINFIMLSNVSHRYKVTNNKEHMRHKTEIKIKMTLPK
mgnify:CR=1 FL=1